MTSNSKPAVGTIAALWRFPVKSMIGEQLQEMDVTDAGVLGDRAYALIEADTGKVVSAKSIKLFPDLLRRCRRCELRYRPDCRYEATLAMWTRCFPSIFTEV